MIPKAIKRAHILKALSEIDKAEIPANRISRNYYLHANNRYYPPKYVISIASKFATSKELIPGDFSGGVEVNNYLKKLGFNIVDRKISDTSKERELNVCCVVLQYKWSMDNWHKVPLNTRLLLLTNILDNIDKQTDLVILPAGYIHTGNASYKRSLDKLEEKVKSIIRMYAPNSTVCFGIDGNNRSEHIGIAVNKSGRIATGRKFYHFDDSVIVAKDPYVDEQNQMRVFTIGDKVIYLAVCYDIFGISRQKVDNKLQADIIVSMVHIFNKSGGGSSATDFARKGLAGAAREWKAKVFASATFAENKACLNWPAGVTWKHGNKSVVGFKYKDIRLKSRQKVLEFDEFTVNYNYYIS